MDEKAEGDQRRDDELDSVQNDIKEREGIILYYVNHEKTRIE